MVLNLHCIIKPRIPEPTPMPEANPISWIGQCPTPGSHAPGWSNPFLQQSLLWSDLASPWVPPLVILVCRRLFQISGTEWVPGPQTKNRGFNETLAPSLVGTCCFYQYILGSAFSSATSWCLLLLSLLALSSSGPFTWICKFLICKIRLIISSYNPDISRMALPLK